MQAKQLVTVAINSFGIRDTDELRDLLNVSWATVDFPTPSIVKGPHHKSTRSIHTLAHTSIGDVLTRWITLCFDVLFFVRTVRFAIHTWWGWNYTCAPVAMLVLCHPDIEQGRCVLYCWIVLWPFLVQNLKGRELSRYSTQEFGWGLLILCLMQPTECISSVVSGNPLQSLSNTVSQVVNLTTIESSQQQEHTVKSLHNCAIRTWTDFPRSEVRTWSRFPLWSQAVGLFT